MRWLKRRQNRDGSVRWYVYPPGRKPVRLPDLPHEHPDFLAAYAAAVREAPETPRRAVKPGSVEAVAASYKTSAAARDLAPSSRRIRDRALGAIVAKAGHFAVRTLAARHVRADLAPLARGSAMHRLQAWRALFRQAVAMGLIEADPSATIRLAPAKRAGRRMWPAAVVEAYRARWPVGTEQRLALELGLYTGARVSDLVGLGWQAVGRDGWMTWRQEKTGGTVSIPFTAPAPIPADLADDHAHLMAALEVARGRMLFLPSQRGAARSRGAFTHWIADACKAGAIPGGYTPHGWRTTRLTLLAEAGWTTHAIAAWSGHRTLKEVEGYTRDAAKRRLIEDAGQPRRFGHAKE